MTAFRIQILTVAGALIAGFAGGCLSTLITPRHRSARKTLTQSGAFEVVDDLGHIRARLGEHGLDVFDADGRLKATLRLQSNNQGILGFSDGKWEGRAVFGSLIGDTGTSDSGNWGLAIYDPRYHSPVVGLATDETGTRGSVGVTDPACRKPLFCLPAR